MPINHAGYIGPLAKPGRKRERVTMLTITSSGKTLGATVSGIDFAKPLASADCEVIRLALGEHGVLCFPNQHLEPAHQIAFASQFGTLEVNVAAGPYTEPGHPEMMILSNIEQDGRAIGLGDAGQGWHTDMSYSREIAFANVLYALQVPVRDGQPLGGTMFANMHAAYESLPDDIKHRLEGRQAVHDFQKFWDMMRQRPGSTRGPLTPEQRAKKPPVAHPIFLLHPLTNRRVLYCNPGYSVRIEGLPQDESDDLLKLLFKHQLQERFQYTHQWSVNDVLIWENIGTLHNAIADYGPQEHRYIRRCQVMADKVFAAA
ncbi:MAG: TauD/TfdA dioxygenase family protein [Hyphomicrobiaceae bacterium]